MYTQSQKWLENWSKTCSSFSTSIARPTGYISTIKNGNECCDPALYYDTRIIEFFQQRPFLGIVPHDQLLKLKNSWLNYLLVVLSSDVAPLKFQLTFRITLFCYTHCTHTYPSCAKGNSSQSTANSYLELISLEWASQCWSKLHFYC